MDKSALRKIIREEISRYKQRKAINEIYLMPATDRVYSAWECGEDVIGRKGGYIDEEALKDALWKASLYTEVVGFTQRGSKAVKIEFEDGTDCTLRLKIKKADGKLMYGPIEDIDY